MSSHDQRMDLDRQVARLSESADVSVVRVGRMNTELVEAALSAPGLPTGGARFR
jgi:predicted site-specific integrase-resolvase